MKESKYAVVGSMGVGAIVVASLLLAVLTRNNGIDGNDTGRVFLAILSFGVLVTGIGVVIAAASAYLRNNE